MKTSQSLTILLGLLLVTGTLASYQQTLTAPTFTSTTNADFQGVCTAADRGIRPCTREIAQGCLCYNNGTCVDTGVNKCSDCSRNDVFSVTLGACPRVQTSLCQPIDPTVRLMCTRELYEACVCTKDGNCAVKMANKCSDCQNEDILAIFRGNTCPAEKLQSSIAAENGSPFTPTKCPNYNGAMVRCSTEPNPGCACYKDGTCKYVTEGNTCTLCSVTDTKVVSFNPGEKCPAKPTKPQADFTPKKCPNYNGAMVKCSSEPNPGCACYKDGTCKYVTEGNTCTLCAATNTKVVSFNPGEQCPVKSTKPQKYCNTKDAHECTDANKTTRFCPFFAAMQTCVCYDDGTCKTVSGTNQCIQCQKSNVVSVSQGKPCPAKCNA